MAILLVAASCSIIEDGDITSAEELASLKLTSFQIAQATSSGSSSITATMNYDSVVNLTDPNAGTKITRKVEYSLPALGNLKMKLRSGTTGATKVYIYYTDSKKPYTLGIISQDSLVELYRFRYSSSGQLNKITSFINPIDNLPPTLFTSDSLGYSGPILSDFIRKANGATTSFEIFYNSAGDNEQIVSRMSTGNTTGGGNGDAFNSDGCTGQTSSNACFIINCGTCNSNTSLSVSAIELNGALIQLGLSDRRTSNGGGPSRDGDTFYFHPLMVLRNQMSFGNHLLNIYLIDWCKVNVTTTKPISSDETVTFNYSLSH